MDISRKLKVTGIVAGAIVGSLAVGNACTGVYYARKLNVKYDHKYQYAYWVYPMARVYLSVVTSMKAPVDFSKSVMRAISYNDPGEVSKTMQELYNHQFEWFNEDILYEMIKKIDREYYKRS